MRSMLALAATVTLAALFAVPSPADDAPKPPDQVVKDVRAIYSRIMAMEDKTPNSKEQLEKLLIKPDGSAPSAKGFSEVVAYTAVYGIMFFPTHTPGSMEIDGDTATVKLQAEPLKVVLKKVDGQWKLDTEATMANFPAPFVAMLDALQEMAGGEAEQAAGQTDRATCTSNVKQLVISTFMYAKDHEDTFPDADKWVDEVMPYLQNVHVLCCPASDLEYAYAMNSALSGVKMADIEKPSETVLFFESDLGVRNAHGNADAVADPPRHDGGNFYAFADGHVALSMEIPSFAKASEPVEHGEKHAVVAVTDATFEREVLQAEGPVVVDFWAEWCGPCMRMKPTYHKLAGDFAGHIKFTSVDVDAHQTQSKKLGVRGIPTIILFRDGKEVARQVGAVGETKFRTWLAHHAQ